MSKVHFLSTACQKFVRASEHQDVRGDSEWSCFGGFCEDFVKDLRGVMGCYGASDLV